MSEALRASERRHRALFEQSLAGVYRTTLDGQILDCNLAFARMLGYGSPEELKGLRAADLYFTREDRESFVALLRRARALVNHECRLKARDGRAVEALESVTLDGDGGPGSVIQGTAVDVTERKRAEEHLRRSLKRLEKLFAMTDAANRGVAPADIHALALDALVDGAGTDRASVLLLDEAGVMRFAAWRGISEVYRRAVEGHSPWTRDARDPVPIVVEDAAADPGLGALRDVLRAEGIRALAFIPIYEDRLLGKFMLYFDRPQRPSEEDLAFALTVARHIAAAERRRAAEEALRRSEQRYRGIVEGQPEPVCRFLPNGMLTFVNAAFARYCAKPVARLIGTSLLDLVPEEDRQEVRTHLDALVEGARPRLAERRLRLPCGEMRWIEWHDRVIRDASGQVVELQSLGRDVTERHAAEERLRESEERFRLALEAAAMSTWVCDAATGQVVFAAGLGPVFGLRRGASFASHHAWLQIVHPADRERVDQGLARVLEQGDGFETEYRVVWPDQTTHWVHSRSRVHRDAAGQATRVIQVAVDVTEAKRAGERLRASEAELRALAARLQQIREEERARIAREIHDELGQALTALKLDLGWIRGRLGRPEAASKLVAMSGLVDEMVRTVRRIATELRPGVLDHVGLAAAIEWEAGEFASRTGIPCVLHSALGDCPLERDLATAVFRIFQETLTNVARHADAGQVTVRLGNQDGWLVLEVSDDGRGINDAAIHNPGSLGLLGMRERALAFQGELELSGCAGQGTTVRLRLPLVAVRERAAT